MSFLTESCLRGGREVRRILPDGDFNAPFSGRVRNTCVSLFCLSAQESHEYGRITIRTLTMRNMLKNFLGKSRVADDAEELPKLTSSSIERIKTLFENFPIGRRLRYFPEFRKELVFETILVAYCLNRSYVYSVDAIERDDKGYPAAFWGGDGEHKSPFSQLKQLQFLVPDTSTLEKKLDYQSRALLGREGQFNTGNAISLISNAGPEVWVVDTQVTKRIVLPDGPYADMKMVLLTPDLTTLAAFEQRRTVRAKACAPVTLSFSDGSPPEPCSVVIVDLSETEVRVRVRDRGASIPEMNPGEEVILDVDLGSEERHRTLKGEVLRRSPEHCVIELKGLIKDGRPGSFGLLELLELKAGLLNYSN